MSPPVGAARASIAGAGQVEDAIPESAIHHWRVNEGSGSTVADSIGANDLTINGSSWVSDSSWVGGHALSHDGVDDYEVSDSEITAVADGSAWGMAATVELSNTSHDGVILTNQNVTDSVTAEVQHRSGELAFDIFNTNTYLDTTLAYTGVSAGTKYRVWAIWTGSAYEMYVNNSEVTNTSGTAMGMANDESAGLRVGGETDNGRYLAGAVDDPIVTDDQPTSQEITDDYNRQPWS